MQTTFPQYMRELLSFKKAPPKAVNIELFSMKTPVSTATAAAPPSHSASSQLAFEPGLLTGNGERICANHLISFEYKHLLMPSV